MADDDFFIFAFWALLRVVVPGPPGRSLFYPMKKRNVQVS
jgi:hypothetical protein